MGKNRITISDDGRVYMPAEIIMYPVEIADLFGVYTQTVMANIRSLLKSGIIDPDATGVVTSFGDTVTPLHFGLDMVTALAFRFNSPKARIFREWVIKKMQEDISDYTQYIVRLPTDKTLLN